MDTDLSTTSRPSYLRRTSCVKCLKTGHAVLNGKDVYCRNCFDEYCTHKFRSSFGKFKIFQPSNQRVLIAVSGGSTSAGMLMDLIERSIGADAHKRLQIRPEIIHIVEESTKRIDGDHSVNTLAGIKRFGNDENIGENSKIPVHSIHIGSIFDDDNSFDVKSIDYFDDSDRKNTSSLSKLLESFSSDTSRSDFYRRSKTYLLVRAAKRLGVRFLMIGETCTELSSRILSNTTQGRGGQTRDDVHVLDSRWESTNDVRIVRPLREFHNREIAYYNQFRRLYDAIDFEYEPPGFIAPSSASLQSASDDFVEDLQSRFPATVSTLFASASKLFSTIPGRRKGQSKEAGDAASSVDRCRLCASVLDDDEDDDDFDLEKIRGFCYGCNLNFSELADVSLLPSWMVMKS